MGISKAYFWSIVVLAGGMSYSIGANDASDSLGASYGSGAAWGYGGGLIMLLPMGCCFEFIGAVWCSQKLAGSLANKLLPSLTDASDQIQERMMLAVLISSVFFIMFSSILGMPISCTHTVIGALIGAGLSGLKASTINWKKFGTTVASWFISPALSSALAITLFLLMASLTLGGHVESLYWRLQFTCLIAVICLTFATYMVIALAVDTDIAPIVWEVSLPSAAVASYFFIRLVMTIASNTVTTEKMSFCNFTYSFLGFWSFDPILSRKHKHNLCKELPQMEMPDEKQKNDLMTMFYIDYVLKQAYRVLLLLAACLVCLAHGSNDVANSISPLLVELNLTHHKLHWAYILGGSGIALGVITMGWSTIRVVGKKVIKLDFFKAFACQFATANCVMLGSRLGIPLSTTHCMVGTLFGIQLCNKFGFVGKAYEAITTVNDQGKSKSFVVDVSGKPLNATRGSSVMKSSTEIDMEAEKQKEQDPNFKPEEEKLNPKNEEDDGTPKVEIAEDKKQPVEMSDKSINLATVKKILFFWAITVPVAMGVAYGITELLLIKIDHE